MGEVGHQVAQFGRPWVAAYGRPCLILFGWRLWIIIGRTVTQFNAFAGILGQHPLGDGDIEGHAEQPKGPLNRVWIERRRVVVRARFGRLTFLNDQRIDPAFDVALHDLLNA
jgi:hypothetical protein